jgi:hypothetical protein
LVSAIAPALKEIGRSDNALMKQLTRATASIAMNLADAALIVATTSGSPTVQC